MDQGWAGFAETREHLKEIGLQFVGSGDTAGQTWQPAGGRGEWDQGWLAGNDALAQRQPQSGQGRPAACELSSRIRGKRGGAPGADEAQVLAAVKAAKAQCDMLVVSSSLGN